MTRYQLIETDRAGNSYVVVEDSSFEAVCEEMVKRRRPNYFCQIINPDRVDIDCPTGLTDEEEELLP